MSKLCVDITDKQLESLADEAHEIWADWMKHLFTKGQLLEDGRFAIDKILVENWQRQMSTPYEELSESEKQSDRDVVFRYFDRGEVTQ